MGPGVHAVGDGDGHDERHQVVGHLDGRGERGRLLAQSRRGKPGEARLDADITDASAKLKQEARAETAREVEREAERRNRKGLRDSFFDWF